MEQYDEVHVSGPSLHCQKYRSLVSAILSCHRGLVLCEGVGTACGDMRHWKMSGCVRIGKLVHQTVS